MSFSHLKEFYSFPQFHFSARCHPLPSLPPVSKGSALIGNGSLSIFSDPYFLISSELLMWGCELPAATDWPHSVHLGRLVAWPPPQSSLGCCFLLSAFSLGVILFSPIVYSPLNSTDSWTSPLLTPVSTHKPFLHFFH